MAESSESSDSSSSPLKYVKNKMKSLGEYGDDRFGILDRYTKTFTPEKPLPKWSDSDVEEFIASDPVNGPTLRCAGKVAGFAATQSAIGAISSAAVAWNYSKSPHAFVEKREAVKRDTLTGYLTKTRTNKGSTKARQEIEELSLRIYSNSTTKLPP